MAENRADVQDMVELIRTEKNAGNYEKALSLCQKALNNHEYLVPREEFCHIVTNEKIDIYLAQDQYNQAESLLQPLVTPLWDVQGVSPKSEDILVSFNTITDENMLNSQFLLAKLRRMQGQNSRGHEALLKIFLKLLERLKTSNFIRMADFVEEEIVNTLNLLKQFEEANQIIKDIYERRYTSFGANDPRALSSQVEMAYNRTHAEKYQEAQSLYRDILKKYRELERRAEEIPLKAVYSATIAIVEQDQAFAFKAAGDLSNALDLYEKCLKYWTTNFGPNHIQSLKVQYRMAMVLKDLKSPNHQNLDRALNLLQKVVEGRTLVLGPSHKLTLDTKCQAALISLQKSGHSEKAQKDLVDVYEKQTRFLGESHPDTLRSLQCLVKCLGRRGDHQEAERRARQLLQRCQQECGQKSWEVAKAYGLLAYCFVQLRRFPEAVESHRQALAIWNFLNRGQNDECPETMTTKYNLGYALGQAKRSEEAFDHLMEVYECWKKGAKEVNGKDGHFQNVVFNLANVQQERKMFEDSAKLFQELYDIQVEVLGHDHRRTKGTLANFKRARQRP